MLAAVLNFIGFASAETSSKTCGWAFLDEPKMPKSLIK